MSLRSDLGVPVMRSKLLGPLLVSPSVQHVSQIRFLAQPAKDVARATSFAILVKAYTSSASPPPELASGSMRPQPSSWHQSARSLEPSGFHPFAVFILL